MARKGTNKFLNEAKRIMDENIHLARFNDILHSAEKLKKEHFRIINKNQELEDANDELKNMIVNLNDHNRFLHDQVFFLEEILNSLKILVSVKDINRRNMLWYNGNYKRLLGYHHKELQELNCEEYKNLYHPDDHSIIIERNKHISDTSRNRYSCVIRLKHANGSWLRMNSDYIVLKRNPDGSQSQALEILSGIESA